MKSGSGLGMGYFEKVQKEAVDTKDQTQTERTYGLNLTRDTPNGYTNGISIMT